MKKQVVVFTFTHALLIKLLTNLNHYFPFRDKSAFYYFPFRDF